jgi:hypothetical protein
MTANRSIVFASVAAIVAVQIASLADGNWDFHLPWLLVVIGYTGPNHLKQWHPEKLKKVFDAIALIQCQVKCLTPDIHVVTHAGGTGILTKEGYLRPAKLQLWAQELTVDQVRSQSLIGCSINGLIRNEDLEIIPAFRDCVTQQVFVPASDSVVDWWLRSESSNSWIANAVICNGGGVIGLALLFFALDASESPEFEKALSYGLQDADRNPGLVARAVADELHQALSILADGGLELS